MGKKRTVSPKPAARAVTAERAARLYQILHLLRDGPRTREALTRRLGVDVRSLYRDLELLRHAGVALPLEKGSYSLGSSVEAAAARLPFPDPLLNLAEAMQLAKGRSQAHLKLRQQIEAITQPPSRPARGRGASK